MGINIQLNFRPLYYVQGVTLVSPHFAYARGSTESLARRQV